MRRGKGDMLLMCLLSTHAWHRILLELVLQVVKTSPPSLQDGRKLGYGAMHGIPMVATSPVRAHEAGGGPPGGPGGPVGSPVDIHSYEPPWKQLTDFAMHSDLERLNPGAPHFQHLVNQMHGYHPDMGPPPPGHPAHHPDLGPPPPPPPGPPGEPGPFPDGPAPPPGPGMPPPPTSGAPSVAPANAPPPDADLSYLESTAGPADLTPPDGLLTPPQPDPSANPL